MSSDVVDIVCFIVWIKGVSLLFVLDMVVLYFVDGFDVLMFVCFMMIGLVLCVCDYLYCVLVMFDVLVVLYGLYCSEWLDDLVVVEVVYCVIDWDVFVWFVLCDVIV